ncbi:MAG TPA: hypothetical protein VIV55_09815 [Flavobacterium sp.]
MKLTNGVKDKISAFLNEINVENIDVNYCVDIDEINFENAFDSVYKMIDDNNGFTVEIIYYSNAIEYLKNNDASLQASLSLASEYGYTLDNLSSETLASILATNNARNEFSELEYEFEKFFDDLIVEAEEYEFERFDEWLNSDNVFKSGEDEYKTQCTQYKKSFSYDELLEYFLKEYFID